MYGSVRLESHRICSNPNACICYYNVLKTIPMNLFIYTCTDMATKNASCKAGMLLLTLTVLISIKPLHANMASVYYVTPNITACHENMTVCEELDTYAKYASMYFQPNSAFILLNGTHVLTTELYVENSSHISIKASSLSTQVSCTNTSAFFSFSGVSNLLLSGFVVFNCEFNFYSSNKNTATFHPIKFSNLVWDNSVVNLNCCSVSSPSDSVIFNSYVLITSCDIQQFYLEVISSSTMMVYQSTWSEFTITVSNSSTGIVQSNFTKVLISLASSLLTVNGTHFTHSNVFAEESTIFIYGVNNAFSNNGIISQPNSAIKLISSVLNVAAQSNITFTGNYATNGGALYLDSHSNISITLPTTVYFINNTAFVSGGAIYVEDIQNQNEQPSCFFQVNSANHTLTPSFIFEQNSAQLAGSVLYGGNLDNCILNCDGLPPEYQSTCHNANSNISGIVFDAITIIGAQANQTEIISTISSDPCTVILCDNSSDTYAIYPGQSIFLSLQTVGQRNGICPTGLSIYETKYNNVLQFLRTGESCTSVNISFLLCEVDEIAIQPQTASSCHSKYTVNTVYVSVRYIPGCPPGFQLKPTAVYCTCIALLINKGINCDLNNEAITIQGLEWIGNLSTLGPQHDVIAFASVCPFDYCTNGRPINIMLDIVGQNAQCSNNRRNVLCGECNDGLSASLGSSNCKKCSNDLLALLVVFAVMGVALVLFLFVTNLTVPTGTINGLIFYANIVRSNKDIFFTQAQGGFATFLQTFIAWMNLDFGIEVCFYDGMDNYAKAWLQFMFPTYILTLVGIFILIGRYSQAISNMCRYNAVPVVATLLYLSYAKLIQTTIIIFAPATLELSDNKEKHVWQYDGNIEYLGSKHAWLFVFGLLVTVGLIIPYTSLILLSPCLQSWSHRRYLTWVNKLKPFLDCYQACFKDKYRYWIGVLLVVRIGLYIVFTLIQNSNTKLGVIITVVMLYTTVVCSLSVYKDWRGQTLEVFFMLNLIFLALSSYQSISTNGLVIQFLIASVFVCFVFLALGLLSKRYLHHCKRIKGRNISSRTEEKHLCNAPAPFITYGTRDKTLNMFREPLMDDDEQGD